MTGTYLTLLSCGEVKYDHAELCEQDGFRICSAVIIHLKGSL